jgi:hypothetical protein
MMMTVDPFRAYGMIAYLWTPPTFDIERRSCWIRWADIGHWYGSGEFNWMKSVGIITPHAAGYLLYT